MGLQGETKNRRDYEAQGGSDERRPAGKSQRTGREEFAVEFKDVVITPNPAPLIFLVQSAVDLTPDPQNQNQAERVKAR
jgi:hypothetical protein